MTDILQAVHVSAPVGNNLHPSHIFLAYPTLIAPVVMPVKATLRERRLRGVPPKLSKRERATIARRIAELEAIDALQGVNFSRMQIDTVLTSHAAGVDIQFETLGPYLASYIKGNGIMTPRNLIPEDAIGIHLAATLRQLLPRAKLRSLYDEYNTAIWSATQAKDIAAGRELPPAFSERAKRNFRESLVGLFKGYGAVPPDAVDGRDYTLIAESSKVADADELVRRLDERGCIRRNGEEILFVNEDAENPLFASITLRTKNGRWLCEALDAATFLKPDLGNTLHVVVLPDYMRTQQDKVWEIMRMLDVRPTNYHNIFFDPARSPEHICQVVSDVFKQAEALLSRLRGDIGA